MPTTHSDPVFVVDEVIHYCVANMPGGVPITSTMALTNATLPYVEAIAADGLAAAVGPTPRWRGASTSSPAPSPTRPSPSARARRTRRFATRSRPAGSETHDCGRFSFLRAGSSASG